MSEADLRQLVADSCHILFNEGQEHFYLGHVSARDPGGDRIVVKPSGLGLGEVTAGDLLVIDLAGKRLAGERPIHQEMPIHTEIYRRRPDVKCVVHTHPFHTAAFASATADFKMVSQDSVLFARGFGFYPSAQLVVTPEFGRDLADCLGDRSIAVLKNHGIAAVGATVQEATFLAVSFDRSLQMQLLAGQFGPIRPIPKEEAEAMHDRFAGGLPQRTQTVWNYLLRKAHRGSADEGDW